MLKRLLGLISSKKDRIIIANVIAIILTAILGKEYISEKTIDLILTLIAALGGVRIWAHAHTDAKVTAAQVLAEKLANNGKDNLLDPTKKDS